MASVKKKNSAKRGKPERAVAKAAPKKPISARLKAKPEPLKKSKTSLLKRGKSDKAPIKEAVRKPEKVTPPKPLTQAILQIRQRLMSMLNEVRKDIDQEVRGASDRDLAHINDTSDMASDSAEGELSLRIAESETAEASEIERAIEKIDTGTYGICETCNKAIGAERLEYLPYVTLCIKCQELSEIRKRSQGDELDDLAEGTDADSDNG